MKKISFNKWFESLKKHAMAHGFSKTTVDCFPMTEWKKHRYYTSGMSPAQAAEKLANPK